MRVVAIKLSTGEEIIAREINSIDGKVFLSSPRTMQVYQTERGVNAGLVPWLLTDPDAEVVIDYQHIVTVISCPAEIETSYLQQTSKLDLTSKLAV